MTNEIIRHSIGRHVTLTACWGQRKGKNGEFEDFAEVLIGDFTAERATKKFRKALCDPTITINNVEPERAYYRMPLHEFIAKAEKIQEK